jgi:DGQHR domain-containing protein
MPDPPIAMNPISVPAIQFRQNGCTFYLASMLAGELIKSYKVHIADPTKDISLKNGYQRKLQPRVKKIAEYFAQDDAVMPLGGLANLRSKSARSAPLEFESEDSEGHPCRHGTLSIPSSRLPLWIVDAQHRISGIKYAIEEMDLENLRSYPLVLTIADGMSLEWEAEQFDLINTTQKKVDTGLARQILAGMVQADPALAEKIKRQGRTWQVIGAELAHALNVRCPALKDRIRQPNQTAKDNPMTNLTASTFVTTIKRTLKLPGISAIAKDSERLEELFCNFWSAVKSHVPEAFAEPKKYNLLSSIGAGSLHGIIGDALHYSRGMTTVASFKKVLAPVFLEYGEDFWIKTNKVDGAGLYVGASRQAALADSFRELIESAFED